MTHKILVVDDDADSRRILRIVLGSVADILEAADGEEALRKIKSKKPNLVLLDIAMPKMGGLDVLESALKLAPGLIVVMLTGQSDIGVAKAALDKGARAYITKPVDPQRLREEVEDLLGLNAPADDPLRRKPWRVVG